MSKHIVKELFEENYNHFKYFLNKRYQSLNEYDVEDIIQQTVIKLLYKGDDIAAIQNLSAYVYSSLSNGAKDYFKKYNRVEVHEEYSEHFTTLQTDSAEDILLLKELKHHIKQVLKNMNPKLRFIFIETEIKGRSYQEIMDLTGDKLGTLLSRKNRAKRKLQEAILTYLNER